MEKSINISIPLADLANAIVAQLLPVLQEQKTQSSFKNKNEGFLTRKQVATLLNVSLPTLNEYTKQGKIVGYRFGTRVLYKQEEISNALMQIK